MSNIITLERPKHITSLRSSGILVEAKVHSTTLTIRDKYIGDEVARDKNAESREIEVNKKLAVKVPEFRLLQNHRQTVHNGLNLYCYDFAGDFKYLPAPRFETFFQWWDRMVIQHAELKKNFLAAWDIYRSGIIFSNSNNTLFSADEYPTVEALSPKFTITLFKSVVPDNDFREVLFREALGDAETAYQYDLNEKAQTMLDQQFDQVAKLCKSLSDCCDLRVVTNDNGETKIERPKLYDSTLQKAIELCETFKKFNPSGSDKLEDARQMLADALTGVTIDTLRDSDTQRLEVKNKVDDMISKFSF
jgi:hypothetical protein